MKKQRWEEPTKRKEEEIRTETTGRRSKIQVREKVEKSRNTVFFHGFVGVPLRGRVVVGENRWRWSGGGR